MITATELFFIGFLVCLGAIVWVSWLTFSLWELRNELENHKQDIASNRKNINENRASIDTNKRRAQALERHLGVSVLRDDNYRFIVCIEHTQDTEDET